MTTYTAGIDTIKNKHVILSYRNNTVTEQYAYVYNVSDEEAKEIFQETLKFLYVRSRSQQNILVPSECIGQMWRLFIQDTKEYDNFCHFYLLKYIHHEINTDFSKDYSKEFNITKQEIKNNFSLYSTDIWEQNNSTYQSLALKADIIPYTAQQPQIIKRNNSHTGCVETIVILFIFGAFLLWTFISLYNTGE